MAKVTARFFRLEKIHQSAPAVENALQAAFNAGRTASEREKQVFGHTLRLERFSPDNTFYDGEIVRKQTTDIPPEANDAGLQKLSVSAGGGIGHCIAFRYNAPLQVLAIQFDNRAVSVNRLLAYLREFDQSYDYRPEPIVREDAWEKYDRGLPRKFELEIASPQNLESVEGDPGPVVDSFRRLGEITDGPVIRVEVKMGRRKGALAKKALDPIIRYFYQGAGRTEDVRKLTVTSADEDGSESINFLDDLLKESRDVEVPEGDPDGHYKKRRDWLETCFGMHFEYIRQVYGASDAAN